MEGEAWEATVHRVAESRTRLSDFTFRTNFIFQVQVFTSLVKFVPNTVLRELFCEFFSP